MRRNHFSWDGKGRRGRGSVRRMSAAGAASTIPQENSDMNVLCTPDQPLKSAWFPAPSRAVLSVWVTGQSRCREVCVAACRPSFEIPHACFYSSSCIERDPDSCTRLEVGVFLALQSLVFETKLFYPRLIAYMLRSNGPILLWQPPFNFNVQIINWNAIHHLFKIYH